MFSATDLKNENKMTILYFD